MINNENHEKQPHQKDYKFFFIAHLFSVFFAFIALVLILVKGLPNFSTLAQSQCNSYYQTKYAAKGEVNFILSLIQLIINFVAVLIITIILIITICKQKNVKHIIGKLKIQGSIKITLYILYSLSLLTLINPIGFHIELLIEKDQCIKTIQHEWIIFLAILLTQLIFVVCCWICTVFYLQQAEQSTKQAKEQEDTVSFAADHPQVFRPNKSQFQNNSHFFSPQFASPEDRKLKKVKTFNFVKQELQKLKKKVIHPNQSTFQNKRFQNPTLLNRPNNLQEYMDHSYQRQRKQQKKKLQNAQKQFQIFHQDKIHFPGFPNNPYSRLIDTDETRRDEMKKQSQVKNNEEQNIIYQRKKVSKKVLFIDEESEGNEEVHVEKQKKKVFQLQVGNSLRQKFTNKQQQP